VKSLSVDDLVGEFCRRWEETRVRDGRGDLTACIRFIRDTIRIGPEKANVRADIEDRRERKGLSVSPRPKQMRAVIGEIGDLVCAVAAARGVSIEEIVGQNRAQKVSTVRFEAMWLARSYGFSYPDIGAAMLRHHTTVIAGERVVRDRIAKRPGLRRELLALGARAGGARQPEKQAA
jgi:DnaA-like protein